MWRRRSFRRISTASAVLVAAALALSAPAATAQERGGATPRGSLAALGDSYSSGVGTPNPDPAALACYRTPYAWPVLVGAALDRPTVNLACAGAKTADVVAPFGGQPAQTAALAALRPRPVFVTITIGGNDVGFGPVLTTCFVSDCTGAVAASEVAMVTVLPGRLAATYRAVEAADPRARLVVVGYPRLFPTHAADVTGCPWLSDAERRSLNEAAKLLDGVIAVEAWLAGATYVDVSGALSGHELCSADPWLVPLPEPMAAHPTIEGQQAIAALVTAALENLRPTPSRPRAGRAALPSLPAAAHS
jgi:lysophospholipase L1-like esterase